MSREGHGSASTKTMKPTNSSSFAGARNNINVEISSVDSYVSDGNRMSITVSDSLIGWSRKAAMKLLSSGEEMIQLPHAESFFVGRSKCTDILCVGKMNVKGIDLFILQKK